MVNFDEFLKPQSLRSNKVSRQKLVENAKAEKLKCDIFGDFHTLCFLEKCAGLVSLSH